MFDKELSALDSLPPVPEEVVQPEPEAIVEQPQEPIQEQQESLSAKHFKTVKQLKEQAERERDEALRKAAELESRLAAQQAPQEEDFNLGNDEIAEGKHLNKVASKIKKLEDTIKQYQQQSSASMVEARLKIEYPDIERVVSKENIEVLSAQYPEIAATINSSGDLYNKAVSAYTLIKKLGISPDDTFHNDRARAQVNAAKPRPLTSISPQQGDSPLSHANAFANGLTDELKSSLLKEMMAARR